MIPKQIHLSWKTKDIFESKSLLIDKGINRLIKLNSNWNFNISTDEEINDYLKDNLGIDYKFVEDFQIVPKTDIWRLFKMFNEGGIYMDIDRFADVVLDDVILDKFKQVLPVCRSYDFSHDIMISEPNNILFANALDLYMYRRKQGHKNIYFLGPQTYMHAITQTFLGKIIDTNPGDKIFSHMMEKLNEIPWLLTFQEDPPYYTFLFRNKEIIGDHEILKRELYKTYNLTHWTGEW